MNRTERKNKDITGRNNTSLPEADPRELPDSKQQPVWHVIVLGALTCAVPYVIYWSYKNWRDLKNEASQYPDMDGTEPLSVFARINPALRAAGLLVPILQIYLLAVLVLGIANLDPDKTSFASRRPLVACGVVMGSFLLLLNFAHLPGGFFLLSCLSPIPLAFAQHWLNRYWATVEPDGMCVRHAFSIWEMLAIIVGASVIGLATAGIMIGIHPH
jgi:hypothetical protein